MEYACEINPDSLGLGIYQYWNIYFDTSPFKIPHILISFNAQAFILQLSAPYSGDNLKFRTRGAGINEWSVWKKLQNNYEE